MEYTAAWPGPGLHCGDGLTRDASRTSTGTEPSCECRSGSRSEDKSFGNGSCRSAIVRHAEFSRAAVGQCQPPAPGRRLPTTQREHGASAGKRAFATQRAPAQYRGLRASRVASTFTRQHRRHPNPSRRPKSPGRSGSELRSALTVTKLASDGRAAVMPFAKLRRRIHRTDARRAACASKGPA